MGASYCTEGNGTAGSKGGPSGDAYSCGAWSDKRTAAANHQAHVALFNDAFPEYEASQQPAPLYVDLDPRPAQAKASPSSGPETHAATQPGSQAARQPGSQAARQPASQPASQPRSQTASDRRISSQR